METSDNVNIITITSVIRWLAPPVRTIYLSSIMVRSVTRVKAKITLFNAKNTEECACLILVNRNGIIGRTYGSRIAKTLFRNVTRNTVGYSKQLKYYLFS